MLQSFLKLVFNANFEFTMENNLLGSTELGFKQNDSCSNQLISITHPNPVFLDRI